MESEDSGVVIVLVIDSRPAGVISRCRECKTTLRQGKFTIGLIIGNEEYLVAEDSSIACCGQDKFLPLHFDDEDEAEQARDKIIETLRADGHMGGLSLLRSNIIAHHVPPASPIRH